MSVVSIICSARKFLKVAAADELPFVHDDGAIVIGSAHREVLTWTNRTDETPLTQVSRTPHTATRSHELISARDACIRATSVPERAEN